MTEDEESLTPEERLQMENNLLKLKLMAEHEAHFPDESKLDPAVENEWLNYIYDFEEQHKNARQIPLYEYIGKPEFKKIDELNDKQVADELDRLLDIMGENGINLDCLAEYDDRTIYAFITDELFSHEIDDVRIEGMTTNFIYEEFHPNHDYDLRRNTEDFLKALLEREWMEYDEHALAKNMESSNGEKIDRDGYISRIELFQGAWKRFEVLRKDIEKVDFDLDKCRAVVEVGLKFNALSEDNHTTSFEGVATLLFEYEYEYWSLIGAEIPGF